MSLLIHVKDDVDLKNYYYTLCDFYKYEDSFSKNDKKITNATIQGLSNMIFKSIDVEGTYIENINKDYFEKYFRLFQDDILATIKDCCQNGLEYEQFLFCVDQIIVLVKGREKALEMARKLYQESKAADEVNEEEIIYDNATNNEKVYDTDIVGDREEVLV